MNEPTRYALVIVRDPRVPPNVIPKARDDGEWVRYDDVAPYLPKTLTADDPRPPDESVLLDRVGDAWQVWAGVLRCVKDVGPWEWAEAAKEYGPLILIHRGGTE